MNRLTRAVRRLFRQQVLVATYLGETGTGPSFADRAVPVMGAVARQIRVVKDRQGVEVVSTATVYCDPSKESLFAAQSRVTLPGGDTADVIVAGVHADHRGRDTVLEVAAG